MGWKMNFDIARKRMVQEQIIARGVNDPGSDRRLAQKIPRHIFVQEAMAAQAYSDTAALPIGEKQTISQPYMVALMTELLELTGREKVLEIGTGSGYQTAVLASAGRNGFSRH